MLLSAVDSPAPKSGTDDGRPLLSVVTRSQERACGGARDATRSMLHGTSGGNEGEPGGATRQRGNTSCVSFACLIFYRVTRWLLPHESANQDLGRNEPTVIAYLGSTYCGSAIGRSGSSVTPAGVYIMAPGPS